MKTNLSILTLFIAISFLSTQTGKQQTDPLSSWNATPIRASLITYITKTAQAIPVEDRIAVFDLDGTLACEKPLWFEMYVAVKGLNEQSAKNRALLKLKEYQFAQKFAINPNDKSVNDSLVTAKANYIDSMVWKAYSGTDHEAYIDTARALLSRTENKDKRIKLANMFYQPMLELIQLLKDNQFKVYVVSGSVKGVIWSICPQVLETDRTHLIGTNQILEPVYKPADKKTSFMIQPGILKPKDDKAGKSKNIYAQLGKVPVFAFGNTVSDFDMFHLTSTSKYPNAIYLLNHDDNREYVYPPYYSPTDPGWRDSMRIYHWETVNMSENFKVVWMKK